MKPFRAIFIGALSAVLSQSHPMAQAVEPDPLWEILPPPCESVTAEGWVQTSTKKLESDKAKASKITVEVDAATFQNRDVDQAKENLKTAFSDGLIPAPNAINIAAAVCGKVAGCPERTACNGSGKNYEVTDAIIDGWSSSNNKKTVSGRVYMKLSKGACTCPS